MRGYVVATMNLQRIVLFLLGFLLASSSAQSYRYGRRIKRCDDNVDVAIVGGGPAGTYAAYQLRNTGQRVHLYEYSDRIGGRLFTYSLPDAPDVNTELGGMRYVDGVHTRLQTVIKDLGLTEIPFVEGFGRTGRTLYYVRGQHVSQFDMLFGNIPYNLTPGEKANQHRIWGYYFELLTGIDTDTTNYKTLHFIKTLDGTPLYRLTVLEALQRVASLEGLEFARDFMVFHSSFDGDVSAVVAFDEMLGEEGLGDVKTVAEGMSAVPIRLAEEFEAASGSNTILLNKKLDSITKRGNGDMILRFQNTNSVPGSTTVDESSSERVCAKRVILALPLFALSLVRWRPIQSRNYQDALGAFNVDHAQKVFMTFDHPWWLDSPTHYYVTKSDESYSQSYDFKNSSQTNNSVLLVSYADAFDADFHQTLQNTGNPLPSTAPGENRVTTTMRDVLLGQLAEVYQVDVSSIPPILSNVAVFWNKFPFGGGWTSWKAGYHPEDVLNRIRRPSLKDDVYVVGSDFQFGIRTPWVEAGFETVEDVLMAYNFL